MQDYSTNEIAIKRGIFQGDSLSPLWFCLALNPLSGMLNRSGYGYPLDNQTNISHLFYMDDLKLYARNREQLRGSLELVRSFSKAVCMELGMDKCAVLHAERGRAVASADMALIDAVTIIPAIKPAQSYKYLGFQQGLDINERENKDKVRNEFFRRTSIVLRTYLNSKNKITALNIWAMPVLGNSFGVLAWSQTDLQALDRRLRTLLTHHRMLHPKSAVERL